jgi:hypothetical protein
MADSRSPGTLTLECVQDKLEELRGTLPRPIPDTPYGWEVRDEIARCMFLALHPADVLDATFACQIILLNAHADDSLRLAREAVHDPKFARSARAPGTFHDAPDAGHARRPARPSTGARHDTGRTAATSPRNRPGPTAPGPTTKPTRHIRRRCQGEARRPHPRTGSARCRNTGHEALT